jgi:hypothetical protein
MARPRIADACRASSPPLLLHVQYVLLLWLSMLVLIPFDIVLVDSSLGQAATSAHPATAVGGQAAATPSYPPIVGTILRLCQRYLASPGSTREMAAVVLGRLLTRPDMAPALAEFLGWGCQALGSSDSQRASFLVPGAVAGPRSGQGILAHIIFCL